MNKILLGLVLAALGYSVWYHFNHVEVYAVTKPVQAVEEIVPQEAQEPLEEAIRPPAPPEGEFEAIQVVSKVEEKESLQEIEEVVQNAPVKASKPVVVTRKVAPPVDLEAKAAERKAKEKQNKLINLNKELDKEVRTAASIRQYITACQADIKAVQGRYDRQAQIERQRDLAKSRPNRYRNVDIPDGESKRLIDRDWNRVNSDYNRAINNLARSEREIEELKAKIAGLK